MKNTVRKRAAGYPHSISRVYLNVATAVLSIVMALLLLRENVLVLSYYLVLTSILAVIPFVLKIRLPSIGQSTSQDNSFLNEESSPQKRLIALLFVTIFALLASPFLLAGFMPPHFWFILIVGVVTGLSVSEILFYIYCKRE
jgi:cobalamin synthase